MTVSTIDFDEQTPTCYFCGDPVDGTLTLTVDTDPGDPEVGPPAGALRRPGLRGLPRGSGGRDRQGGGGPRGVGAMIHVCPVEIGAALAALPVLRWAVSWLLKKAVNFRQQRAYLVRGRRG